MAKPKKLPKAAYNPQPTKTPKIQQLPPNFRGAALAWRFNAVDKDGPYSWLNLQDPADYKAIIEKLADLETMTEAHLGAHGCHFIEVAKICKEAQDRLREINLDDIDEIYSMRMTGKVRVHCVHRHNYMRVLWYDPEHAVCPSIKKHT